MKALILCLTSGVLLASAGCDRPANPPAPANTRPSASLNPPATRPSAAASRKVMQLSPYPLKISVPDDWSILDIGNVMFLQGPTPGGLEPEDVARIQVSHPPTISTASAQRLEKDILANKDTADGSVLKTDARPSGKAKLFEKRAVEKLSDGSGILVNWTVDVMLAGDNDRTSMYHLNFVALSQARYEKDRPFLESIVSTVEYDASLEIRPK